MAEAAADGVYYLAAPCGSSAIREGLPVRPRESCWGVRTERWDERGEEEREGMRRGEERRGICLRTTSFMASEGDGF